MQSGRCPSFLIFLFWFVSTWSGLQEEARPGFRKSQVSREVLRLSASKSQRFLRFAIAMPIADPGNRAISETRQSSVALRFKRCDGKSLAICDFRLRFLSPKPLLSAGFLAICLRQRAIAIVRFWCAKSCAVIFSQFLKRACVGETLSRILPGLVPVR